MSANDDELDRERMAARLREGSVGVGDLPSEDGDQDREGGGLDRERGAARLREGSVGVGELPSEPAPGEDAGETTATDEQPTDAERQEQTGGTAEATTQDGQPTQQTDETRTVESEAEARDVFEEQLEAQTGQDLQPGTDFTVQQTDQGFRAAFSDEFRRGIAEARFEEQLEAETGRDVEPGRDFRAVQTPDDRFRADLQPKGRRRAGATARRQDPDVLVPPSQVEQGFEFERLSRREVGARRRRQDAEALTPPSQVEQGAEFDVTTAREVMAARRREDPEALTAPSQVEQGVEFDRQPTEAPKTGIGRIAAGLDITTSRARDLAERGELQERIDKAGLRDTATASDVSDRVSETAEDFREGLVKSERAPRSAALTKPQRRVRNLLGGGLDDTGVDFTGPRGELESELESQTGVDLGPADISFETQTRDGERVLTGGLTREGARTVAVETAPFQDSPIEGVTEAAARAEVETDLLASDVRETIREETNVDALFKGTPDIDLEEVGSGLVGAGAVGVATPEPVTSGAGLAGAAVGTGIVGAGVLLQGEPPEARAETELPVQEPAQDQSEIEAPEEAVSPASEIDVPARRERFKQSEFEVPPRGFERPSEISVGGATRIESRRGEVDVPTDPDDILIRTQQATGGLRQREREERDVTVITEEDIEDVDPAIDEDERLQQIREELERRQEAAREDGRQFEERPGESRREQATEPEVEDVSPELERETDTLAETVTDPSVDRTKQAVATRQDAETRRTAAQTPFSRRLSAGRPVLGADAGLLGGVTTQTQQRELAFEDLGSDLSSIPAQDISTRSRALTETVQITTTPAQFQRFIPNKTTTITPPDFTPDFPFEPNRPPVITTTPPGTPGINTPLRTQLGDVEPDLEPEERDRIGLFGRRTDVRPGDPDEAIRSLDGDSAGVDSSLEDL